MQDIAYINKKYNALQEKYKNAGNVECLGMMNMIDENQRRFLNEREK